MIAPLEPAQTKASPRRWVVLAGTMPALAMTNVCWLTFAPVASLAENCYAAKPLQIAFLSMCFMGLYVLLSVPASWVTDRHGFSVSTAIGAVLTGIFGLTRALGGRDLAWVTISQMGLACGQPFLVNAITKMAAEWFPLRERATAAGIASMAGYLGMILAMVATPWLAMRYDLPTILWIYGVLAVASASLFLLIIRCVPGSHRRAGKASRPDGIQELLTKRDYRYLLVCMFVLMGVFNAVSTWIEEMMAPRGITSIQAGFVGGVMVAVGLVGALVIPAASDRWRQRQPILQAAILAAVLGMVGLVFFNGFPLLLASSALLGFALLGAGPVAFQYGAEVAQPVSEGASYGLLMSAGQVSGMLMTWFLNAGRTWDTGSMYRPLLILLLLMVGAGWLCRRMRESAQMRALPTEGEKGMAFFL